MFSVLEFKRILSEWSIRLQRVKEVLQNPSWSNEDWNKFARAILLMVREYGSSWEDGKSTYWDVRWQLQAGGAMICQVELVDQQKLSLTVAQSGGFADGHENYTWFYAEFADSGNFLGDPYWVDGNWKDALATILLPQHMGAGYYLQANSQLHTGYQIQDSTLPMLKPAADQTTS